MNIDLPVLHAIAKVAEAQPVPVTVELRTSGLTFSAGIGPDEKRCSVYWSQLMEVRRPVELCTSIITALVANTQRTVNRSLRHD